MNPLKDYSTEEVAEIIEIAYMIWYADCERWSWEISIITDKYGIDAEINFWMSFYIWMYEYLKPRYLDRWFVDIIHDLIRDEERYHKLLTKYCILFSKKK